MTNGSYGQERAKTVRRATVIFLEYRHVIKMCDYLFIVFNVDHNYIPDRRPRRSTNSLLVVAASL